ncbi:tol-pal system-associated acyl-CoA thioesterase [Halieaceae bacterium IMCC14734]|uniref:Tol-pal system-associated acyl-CoA thioesterase n=1 Tax=Candidatus Litorirhabdus singularis TaxID=2518993 RepID=A0ABT3TAK8_9GAMM|nr:tol-pal system-associated acyl-CoA thioesterase [Candidatus Litorirhabdus singularis]MCX2979328.1 tol-pal system-associated acyl-CoA thioesterase [Candidatus Litorirhabdus singularis]
MTEAEFSWPLRVYIEDTDAGGIVYYVNYLKYMERARTEFMREQGFGKDYVFNLNLMFVVRDVQINYQLPARLDDELQATARVIEVGAANIVFEQAVLRGAESLAQAQVNIVSVRRDNTRPTRVPAAIRSALSTA